MLAPKYIMQCGCVLKLEELATHNPYRSCPIHNGRVVSVKKICERCGDELIVPRVSEKRIYCASCQKELDRARTVYNFYNIDQFSDLILWHKHSDDIVSDISINVQLGYEAIQIDPPRITQHDINRIRINCNKKRRQLKKAQAMVQTASKQLCGDKLVPGKILKTTKNKILILNFNNNKKYLVDRFAQIRPGQFDIKQSDCVHV